MLIQVINTHYQLVYCNHIFYSKLNLGVQKIFKTSINGPQMYMVLMVSRFVKNVNDHIMEILLGQDIEIFENENTNKLHFILIF
jgi:hypothetical protein